MADRYWVGGTGTWNTTSTTNWSASSGGGGGASVPTTADNVIFNAASGTGTVTLSGAINCLSYNNSTANISFSGVTTLTCAGNFTHSVATSFTSAISITATSTMNINAGATFTSNLNIQSTGNLTLASSIKFDTINISGGSTFNTANYNITLTGAFNCNVGATVTTVSLGSSTIYMSRLATNNLYNTDTRILGTGLTFTANTATFDFSDTSSGLYMYQPQFTINSPFVIHRVRMSGSIPFTLNLNAGGTGTITNFDSSLTCKGTVFLNSTTTITNWNASGYSSTEKLTLRPLTVTTTSIAMPIVTNNATASNLCIITCNKTGAGSFTLTNSYLVTLTSPTVVGAQLTGWTADTTSSGTNRKAVVLTGTNYIDALWTVPSDWTSTNNEIHVIGGGGSSSGPTGASGQLSSASGSGGGGGGYTKAVNVSLTPSSTVNWTTGVIGATAILQSIWVGNTGRYGTYSGFSRTAVNTITLVGNNKAVANGTASVTVSKPAGTTTGDLLIMFISINGTASNILNWYATDSGWARWLTSTLTAAAQTLVLYKYASASEPSTYTVTNYAGTTATGLIGYVVSYRNALFNTVISKVGVNAAATPATYGGGALTPTSDGSRIISYLFSGSASVTVSSAPSGQTLLDSNATATAPSTFIYTGSFNIASGGQTGSTTLSAASHNLGLILNPTSSYTYLATGGNPGTTWIANTTATGMFTSGGAGGTGSGGTLNYAGGAGGSGGGGSAIANYKGAGGGGGAGGPNGNGGAGGAGVSSTANVAIGGAGGGGSSGGSAGTAGTSAAVAPATGSNGGNNYLGSGGGTSTLTSRDGGGGGGGTGISLLGGTSGNIPSYGADILIGVSLGSSGGGGAAAVGDGTSGGYGYDAATSGGTFGGFGGGAGGANSNPPSGTRASVGAGAPGGIIIIYGGPIPGSNTGNFFFMFN